MNVPRVFDRLVQFDERSRAFPIRAILPTAAKPRSYTWSCGVQLDQGTEGACVGFGVSHEAAARPVCVPNINDASARALYARAKDLDAWEGSDYEGTSVLAGVKAAQELGYYPEYRWGFSLNDAILALGLHGPIVIGVNWYELMFDVDGDGFLHVGGTAVGGHCVCLRGVNVKKKYVLGRNSWGSAWGLNGDFKLSFEDLDRLLHEQGECAIPVKRGKVKP